MLQITRLHILYEIYSYQKKECTVNLFVQLSVAKLMFKSPVERKLLMDSPNIYKN